MAQAHIEEGNVSKFEQSLKVELEKALHHLEKELTTIRTGKAHSSLVELIKVDSYGNMMNLKDVASIATPSSNMITIQPWDTSLVVHIEKALQTSSLGVNPQVDGNMIRIELPKVTTERREELAKVVAKKVEDAKIAFRNVRKDFVTEIKDAEKKKTISEDFGKRLNKALQDLVDKISVQADTIGDKKKKDITTL